MKATLFKILMGIFKGGLSIAYRTIFVYYLWNLLIPDIFLTACEIDFRHAIGLVFLFHILTTNFAEKYKTINTNKPM